MLNKYVEFDDLLNDEAEYLYKGKSHCEDYHRAVRKNLQEVQPNVQSVIS